MMRQRMGVKEYLGFSHLTKNLWPPKLVEGIFEVWWLLQKFLWVKKIICTLNGFVLTDFFPKNKTKQFCVVRTGT